METPSVPTAPLLERARLTFLAPSRLADALRIGHPWLDVLLVSTAIAIVSVATVPDEVFVAQMEDAVTRRGRPVDIVSPPDVIARWGRFMGMLATLATHPIIAFVLAGIALGVVAGIFRSGTTYRQLLAVSCHVLLIPALGTLIRIAGRAAGVAFITPSPDWPLPLRALLAVDPYVVWMLIAMAVAVHAMDSRVPRARAGALLVAGYLVLVFSSTAILHPEATTAIVEESAWRAVPNTTLPSV